MSEDKPRGQSIRIFLVDGTPQGLRTLDLVGWTGTCLTFSRADYSVARSRAELGRSGVYVLIGPQSVGRHDERLYVGEADVLRTRLDAHQREKDFWTHAYILTTRDDSLNKAHVRYLEARLLQLAIKADRAESENGTAPTPLPLGEAEESDMESFLDRALTLLPLAGVFVFDLVAATTDSAGAALPTASPPLEQTSYFLSNVLTEAEGRDDARGFTVLAGGLARKEAKVMNPGYQALRQKLIAEEVLVPHGPEQYRLTKNYVFDSPSSAASVMAGGSKNGRDEWKLQDGRSLKRVQEQSAD